MSFDIINFRVLSTASQPGYRSGMGRGETPGTSLLDCFPTCQNSGI